VTPEAAAVATLLEDTLKFFLQNDIYWFFFCACSQKKKIWWMKETVLFHQKSKDVFFAMMKLE
jgi:hypothetical protein